MLPLVVQSDAALWLSGDIDPGRCGHQEQAVVASATFILRLLGHGLLVLLTGEARLALQDGRERAAHRLPRPQRGPTHRLGGATCAGRPVRPPWRPGLVGTRVVGELCACEIGGVNRGLARCE